MWALSLAPIVPVLLGSAKEQMGLDILLDYIVACMPSPDMATVSGKDAKGETVEITPSKDEPLCAFVYKTISDPLRR